MARWKRVLFRFAELHLRIAQKMEPVHAADRLFRSTADDHTLRAARISRVLVRLDYSCHEDQVAVDDLAREPPRQKWAAPVLVGTDRRPVFQQKPGIIGAVLEQRRGVGRRQNTQLGGFFRGHGPVEPKRDDQRRFCSAPR
jgi:hypothetical protein